MRYFFLPYAVLFLLAACAAAPSAPVAPVALETVTVPTVTVTQLPSFPPSLPTTVTVAPTTPPESSPLPSPTIAPTNPVEIAVKNLPLDAPLDDDDAEISAMGWDRERLVLVPQFPARFDNMLFALERSDLLMQIEAETPAPLTPSVIPFDDGGLSESIRGFEGFEAIAFYGDRFFMTLEVRLTPLTMTGYLVAGTIDADGAMRLDPTTIVELEAPVSLENYSDEAITISEGVLHTFFEANGAVVNPDAATRRFDTDTLAPLESLPMIPLEYRLTDATPADGNHRFWVINYLFVGDIPKLMPAADAIEARFGEGATRNRNAGVERLIELEITTEGISLTDTPPLYLALEWGLPRNWEGIVRLENKGFLLVTDKFPDTRLGFVPYP